MISYLVALFTDKRTPALLALGVTAVLLAYGWGLSVGRADLRASVDEANRAAQAVVRKSETSRLAVQTELDALASALERQAQDAPTSDPSCLSPDGLRRLNSLK